MKATLTFSTREDAKRFASDWVRVTARGYDGPSPARSDGSCQVTIYDLTEDDAQWVNAWVNTKLSNP